MEDERTRKQKRDGREAVNSTGIDADSFPYVPVIFALDSEGAYSSHMLAYDAIPGMEIREDSGREFRGFDRDILRSELAKLRENAK